MKPGIKRSSLERCGAALRVGFEGLCITTVGRFRVFGYAKRAAPRNMEAEVAGLIYAAFDLAIETVVGRKLGERVNRGFFNWEPMADGRRILLEERRDEYLDPSHLAIEFGGGTLAIGYAFGEHLGYQNDLYIATQALFEFDELFSLASGYLREF